MQAKLLEHNVRFGDPECQCLMMRLESDLLEMLLAASDGQLGKIEPKWSAEAALTVVLAAQGYPGAYEKNTLIKGLAQVKGAKVWNSLAIFLNVDGLGESRSSRGLGASSSSCGLGASSSSRGLGASSSSCGLGASSPGCVL